MNPKFPPKPKQPTRRAPTFKPVVAPFKLVQLKTSPLKNGPTSQMRKPPVAPPVYRPQPNPNSVQRKTSTSAQARKPPQAPPVYNPKATAGANSLTKTPVPNHQSAIQPKRTPKAPPVYKPDRSRFGPPKPGAPPKVFSPAPPRHVAVQPKARNGTAVTPPAASGLARVPSPRPITFGRPGSIQLFRMDAYRPEKYCVRRPAGEEQERAFAECWALLGRRAGEDVGDNLREARLNVASILLELVGGKDNYNTKMFAYFLGLRQSAPQPVVGGIGSLHLGGDGMVEGRPGFLSAAFDPEERVAPGQARRHKTAWHNIKALLNAIQVSYGVAALGHVFDVIRPQVPAEVALQAEGILKRVPTTLEGYKVLWLAIVLNSAPDNLWLGGAKENISVNTAASNLRRWTRALDVGEMTLADYHTKIEHHQPGSQKTRYAKAEILKIIGVARQREPEDPSGFVAQMVFKDVISMLEIDLPNEEDLNPHHLEIFKIAQGIGDLADHANIIHQLLGLQPAAAAAAGV